MLSTIARCTPLSRGINIHFRCAEAPSANRGKYEDGWLDAYISVEDGDGLYAEYAARSVEFTRGLANMPWGSRGLRRELIEITPGQYSSSAHPQ